MSRNKTHNRNFKLEISVRTQIADRKLAPLALCLMSLGTIYNKNKVISIDIKAADVDITTCFLKTATKSLCKFLKTVTFYRPFVLLFFVYHLGFKCQLFWLDSIAHRTSNSQFQLMTLEMKKCMQEMLSDCGYR